MNLTWRDGFATVMVALAGAVTISVVAGWSWLFIGDALAGCIAVLVIGFAASVGGGGPNWFLAALRPHGITRVGMAFTLVASLLGLMTFGLLAVGMILNSVELLVSATSTLVALWIIATIHHVMEKLPGPISRRAV